MLIVAGDAAEVDPVVGETESHPLPSMGLAAAWKAIGVTELAYNVTFCGGSACLEPINTKPAGCGSGTAFVEAGLTLSTT
jgi:hypothetical protein